MNYICLIFILFISTSVYSQDINSSTRLKTESSKANNPFSLEFLVASEQTKNIVTNKIDGSFTKMDASLLQSLSADDELRYFLSTRYLTYQNGSSEDSDIKDEFNWYFVEFMYRRKNILTESKHGLYMEFEFKNLYYTDAKIREMYGQNGSTIPQVIFKQRYGRGNSLELKLRRHFNHTNNNSSYTVNFEDRAYLNLSSLVSRRVLLFSQLKYQHKMRKDDGLDYRFMELAEFNYDPMARTVVPDFSNVPEAKKDQEIVTFHPAIMYFLSRNSMIEFYYETKLSNTYDNRKMNEIMNDEAVFGTALYLTAF